MAKPPHDAREIFRSALRWDVSSELLRDEGSAMHERYGSTHDGIVLSPFLTSAVMQAFSIELYLKCLLALDGKRGEGHELEKLFTELGESLQTQVIANEARLKLPPGSISRELEGANQLFKNWRYNYEGETGGFTMFDSPSSKALRHTILDLRPDYSDVYEVARKARHHRLSAEDIQQWRSWT